jgi:hypothetical protein
MLDSVGGTDRNEGSLLLGLFLGFLCCPLGPAIALFTGGSDTRIGAVFAVGVQLLLACAGLATAAFNQLSAAL